MTIDNIACCLFGTNKHQNLMKLKRPTASSEPHKAKQANSKPREQARKQARNHQPPIGHITNQQPHCAHGYLNRSTDRSMIGQQNCL